MKVLIDTHILLWFLEGDRQKISGAALAAIQDQTNEKFVSIASLWEVVIKVNIGKLPMRTTFQSFLALIPANGFQVLSLQSSHLLKYLDLPLRHRDPFDRILVAQSINDNLSVVTKDPNFSLYPIKTIW